MSPDSFMSVSPEADDAQTYLSVSPEPGSGRDSYLDVSSEVHDSQPISLAPSSDRPTLRPQAKKQKSARPLRESSDVPRSPTWPGPEPTPPLRMQSGSSLAAAMAAPLTAFSFPVTSPRSEAQAQAASEVAMPASETAPIAEPEPIEPPVVDGLAFESVEALADLPEEAQAELAASGKLSVLTTGQELVLAEGGALVTRGSVHVTLTFSDVSAARVSVGAVIAARGSIESGPLRLIADAAQTHVVTWTDAQLTQAMRDCPWVVDDLRLLADRFQAHASAGLGPLGARLDDALRAAVYERLQVRVLSPDECVAERGKPLKGLFVVAVGELDVAAGTERRIRAGEFLFPGCVIGAEPAPHDVRAGPKGGLVLFATRPVAHELMMSVPPLLEILAS
jgi:hypothetical protein